MGDQEQRTQQLEAAWSAAGRDLSVRIIVPYDIAVSGVVYRFIAYLPDFGGPRGTVVDVVFPPEFVRDKRRAQVATTAGYFISSVNADVYAVFDLEKFRDALADWGYFGPPESKPSWLIE